MAHHRLRGKARRPQGVAASPRPLQCLDGHLHFQYAVADPHSSCGLRGSKSHHDFGKDILPRIISKHRVFAYNFVDENAKDALYWRDVGTLDAYYEANMDLVSVSPVFNLYDTSWPLRTWQHQYPPAKFVFADPERMASRSIPLWLVARSSPADVFKNP